MVAYMEACDLDLSSTDRSLVSSLLHPAKLMTDVRSSQRGRQMQVGSVKSATFHKQLATMVHNRCIVHIKVEQEIVCTLSIGDIASGLG